MIGRLRGVILEKKPPVCVVDVQGVGYEIEAPMSTFYHLPEIGQTVELYTHLVVREDAQLLYAFYHLQERLLFRQLIKVNGVGPKLALTILSGIEADQFVQCVQHNNTQALMTLPGVGKKTAERLLIEMRDRLKDWHNGTAASVQSAAQDYVQEAVSALISLGYKPQEASRLVSRVQGEYQNSESLIRLALQGSLA